MSDRETGGLTAPVFTQLRLRAQRSNLARVQQLEATLGSANASRLGEDERRRAAHVAHQVVGSAGTFGYLQASDLAAVLEQILQRRDGYEAEFDRVAREALAALRSELETDGSPSSDSVQAIMGGGAECLPGSPKSGPGPSAPGDR